MKLACPGRKNNFAKTVNPNKAFIYFLLVFFGGIVFSSYPKLMREGLATNGKNEAYPPKTQPAKSDAAAAKPTSENEDFVVSGIFYDEENPRVLINEELFSVDSYCCGGRITGIFAEFIVLQFPYGRREYRLGDVIRKEKVKVGQPNPLPRIPLSYVNKVNSLVESFMASHNQYNIALDIRLSANPDEAAQIRVRAQQMLELIQKKKQELAGLSAPDSCKRHYSLTIKLFDIAEDGWRAVSAADKDKAEVFFGRLLKISQEISRESVSILARQ